MVIDGKYAADVEAILSHRHDGGADYWTTPDRRLLKGTPFSAYTSAQMLLELGMPPSDPILTTVAELFLDAWREADGAATMSTGTRSRRPASAAARTGQPVARLAHAPSCHRRPGDTAAAAPPGAHRPAGHRP